MFLFTKAFIKRKEIHISNFSLQRTKSIWDFLRLNVNFILVLYFIIISNAVIAGNKLINQFGPRVSG